MGGQYMNLSLTKPSGKALVGQVLQLVKDIVNMSVFRFAIIEIVCGMTINNVERFEPD